MNSLHVMIDEPVAAALKKAGLQCRPGTSLGIWLSLLLPTAVVLSSMKAPEVSPAYHVTAVVSSGMFGAAANMVLHLAQTSRTKNYSAYAFNKLFFLPAALTALLLLVHSQMSIMYSLTGGLVSTFPFCVGVPLLLRHAPGIFSYGEACVVVQGLVLFLFTGANNISNKLVDLHLDAMEKATLIVQVGNAGLLLVCVALWIFPVLRSTRHFYYILIAVMGGAVVPTLHLIMHESSVLWLVFFVFEGQRAFVLLYWVVCCGVAALVVSAQVRGKELASTALRKHFHLLMLAVYLPGLAWECTLLYLCSGVTFAVLLTLELMRILNIAPMGEGLQQGFLVFADEKDRGGVALTPLYLLVGISLPIWIHPTRCALVSSVALPMLAGLLSVGMGDTAASIVGYRFGRHKWGESNKSKEGTMGSILAQFALVLLLMYTGFLPCSSSVFIKSLGAITVVSLVEALTDQVDNIVLPLVMYILLV